MSQTQCHSQFLCKSIAYTLCLTILWDSSEFPYNSYTGHFCLGIIYDRVDGSTIDETKSYELSQLHSIASIVRNFQFFVAEK